MAKQKIPDDLVVKKYVGIQDNAKARNLPFNLSLKKVRQLLSTTTCYFSKVKFQKEGPNKRTIDRIDSSKGYTDDNVVACTSRMNQIKGNASIAELQLIISGVTRFNKTKRK